AVSFQIKETFFENQTSQPVAVGMLSVECLTDAPAVSSHGPECRVVSTDAGVTFTARHDREREEWPICIPSSSLQCVLLECSQSNGLLCTSAQQFMRTTKSIFTGRFTNFDRLHRSELYFVN